MEEKFLKCFDAWFRTGLVNYIPYSVFEYWKSTRRTPQEYWLWWRISVKYDLSVDKAGGALEAFDENIAKCFDQYLENLSEDYSDYKRLSVHHTTLKVVESGEFEQWAKYLNGIDKSDVKKFERYVRGEF